MMSVVVYTLGFLVAGLLFLYSYYAKILDWILIVMAFPIGMAVLIATGHFPGRSFRNWWLGAYVSTLLFWLIKNYRRSWRNDVFWVTVGILAVLQTLLVYLVGRSVERLSPRWVHPMFMIEGPILVTTLGWALHRFGRHQRRRKITDS